jgi:hypothetical protein
METMDTLQKIIQPQYLDHFADWEKFANDREKKGLKLISAIYKHKGLKKFRADPPSKQLESFQKSNTIEYEFLVIRHANLSIAIRRLRSYTEKIKLLHTILVNSVLKRSQSLKLISSNTKSVLRYNYSSYSVLIMYRLSLRMC